MKVAITICFCILLISNCIRVSAQTKVSFSSLPNDSTLNRLTYQLRAAKQSTNRLILLTQLINRCVELNQLNTASSYLQRGFQLAHHIVNPLLLGRFYAQVGEYYQRVLKYPEVINTLKQAIYYLRQPSQQIELVQAMYRLARAYSYRDMVVQTFKQIEQNLAYARQVNFHRYDVANYTLLYTLYSRRGDKNKALSVLQTMLAVAQQLKSPSDLHLAYANFGEWYDRQHQYSKGLAYHQKALAGILRQGNVDMNYISQDYYAIANNLFQQNRLSETKAVLSRAIRSNREAGILIPGNLFRIQALILEREHRLEEAYQWINKTLPNFRKANPSELVEVLAILIRIQQKRGRYKDAYLLLKEQKLVNDSLQQVENHKALVILEARAELEKQTQRVAILKKNAAINQLELVRIRQQQLLIGGLAFILLLLAIGGGWAAETARTHVKTLRNQNQRSQLQAQHLQELNTVKDKLFSVIGHDLRAPTLYLRTLLKQLSRPSYDARLFDRQLAQLELSVNTIYATLDNLLHWSILQRNQLSTRPSEVELDALTQQVLVLFEPMITQKALEVKLGEGPLWAWVDEVQAQIILRNILHNACKFTSPEGQIKIDYQTVGYESVVTITDSGIGMQTHGEQQPLQGTGLGLVTSQELIQLNGGRLSISSQPGEGTVVTIFFLQSSAHRRAPS